MKNTTQHTHTHTHTRLVHHALRRIQKHSFTASSPFRNKQFTHPFCLLSRRRSMIDCSTFRTFRCTGCTEIPPTLAVSNPTAFRAASETESGWLLAPARRSIAGGSVSHSRSVFDTESTHNRTGRPKPKQAENAQAKTSKGKHAKKKPKRPEQQRTICTTRAFRCAPWSFGVRALGVRISVFGLLEWKTHSPAVLFAHTMMNGSAHANGEINYFKR